MTGAAFALSVNIAIALLFSLSFMIMGLTNKSHRSVLIFALGYAIGILTPTCELLIPIFGDRPILVYLSFASFVTSFAVIAVGIAVFHGRRPPWLLIGVLLVAAYAVRWAIWGGQRGVLSYELLYQLPFSVMLAVCAGLLLLSDKRDRWHGALGGLFVILALHFLIKPLIASHFYPGASARLYTQSTYALISQATTGVLLVATGLLMMLVVMRDILITTQLEGESDGLTGVRNRRGFDARASAALVRHDHARSPLSVMMIDIDRFKAINDSFGHSCGDEVIRAMAGLLLHTLPQGTLIGRIGGEEFAILLPALSVERMHDLGETLRTAFAGLVFSGLPADFRATVSAGVTQARPGESLPELMRRADAALYRAKRGGRNRVVVDAPGRD